MNSKLLNSIVSLKYLSYWIILMIDTVASTACTLAACLITGYIFHSAELSTGTVLRILLISMPVSVLSFFAFKTFRNIIRHSTIKDLWRIVSATLLKAVILYLLVGYMGYIGGVGLTLCISFDVMLTMITLIAMRVLMVLFFDTVVSKVSRKDCNTLIYGIGDKSVSLATRLHNNEKYNIIGFYVFGHNYRSYRLAGLHVYYFIDEKDFEWVHSRKGVEAILFPDYKTAQAERDRLIRFCEHSRVRILIAPPVDEISEDTLFKTGIREIRIEDLLGREEIKINLDEVNSYFSGRTVLVTGAAGSIGSELCRQLAGFGVGKLVMYDNAETPMHNIRLEMEEKFPHLMTVPVIGDVRNPKRLDMVFRVYSPQVVFHAAAYKHVPLMEENPCEAVLANVYGTRNVADLAVSYGTEMMVMISTDKAVNPTNVMGASKRLSEIYVQSLGTAIAAGKVPGRTHFVTTRFGNVLGSNGSVIPRFRKQIEQGGPVTVTHPDITRFFMTIPEACRLVMEAATMGAGNEIFVFEMGELVRIADLARRMIELAGYRPDEDINIVYTGLRPGEKLYEEVLSCDESCTIPTSHQKIKIAKVREYSYYGIKDAVGELVRLAAVARVDETVRLMKRIIPEFKSRNSRFEHLDLELESEPDVGDTEIFHNVRLGDEV